MSLKPQDVFVLLKLVALGREPWTYQRLAVELSISQSEAHAAVRRAVAAKLMSDATTAAGRPVMASLLEFLVHGVRYAFPGHVELTAYDASYLELALRESAPLATHDEALRAAASKLGVELFSTGSP